MLELHHNFASSCSQKVRLVLAEKALDYESHTVDLMAGEQHASDYVKLNPNHVVPTLVHDGRVLIESTLINEYLEDAFPEPSVRPSDPVARHKMRLWTKRVDEKVHPQAGVITYAIGTRPLIIQSPPDEIEAKINAIPNPVQRAKRKSVIEHGVKAPEMGEAMSAFVAMLDDMESGLADGPWLAGAEWSLADACVLPYVLRLDHLAMTPLIEARPRAADWFARMQARPSYATAISAHIPEFVVELFRKHGDEAWPEVQKLVS